MAGRVGNKTWLRQQLQKVLQWDADAAEAMVEAVAASSSDEVDQLVEAYMGGNPTARQLVRQFCGPAGGTAAAAGAPPGMQMLQRGAPQQPGRGSGAAPSGSGQSAGGSRTGSGGGRGPPQTMELQPPAGKPKPDLYMGPNVRTTVQPARRKGRSGGAAAADAGASQTGAAGAKALQKPVVNCLRCGKIYDCRVLSEEGRRFLASGGVCTFCGSVVTLCYADGTTNAPPDVAGTDTEAASSSSSARVAGASASAAATGAPSSGDLAGFKPEAQQGNAANSVAYNDSAAAAVALKDRLVEYDRESAKRTTVYDDQADFFEIDANAWLTEEERAVLRQREREMAEAEEARRKRVTVSIDLLGRKVVMEEEPPLDAAGGPADTAAVEAQLEAARAAAAARVAAATAAEAAQGGGAAAPTALAAVEDKLRNLRITVNPSMAAKHFVFLPQQGQQQGQQPARQYQQRTQPPPPAAGGSAEGAPSGMAEPGRQGRPVGSRGSRQQKQQRKQAAGRGPSRLQHDDPFDWDLGASAVEVLAADEAGRRALEKAGMLV